MFFDITERAYVTIDKDNYSEYVGHSFMTYQVDNIGYSSKKLITSTISNKVTTAYAVVTDTYYSCITDNMVTATPTIPGIYQMISSYLDEDLQFDIDLFAADVAKYGTYEYEPFEKYLSYEQFVKLCAPFYKVAEAKGYTSFEELYDFVAKYDCFFKQ